MRLTLLLLALSAALAACVFKPEIRQGNFLSDEKIAQVKPGLTPAQVQFILGKVMVQDPFHPDRWDYVQYVNPNNGKPVENWHVVVYFKDGKVDHVEQLSAKNKDTQLQLPVVSDKTTAQDAAGGP